MTHDSTKASQTCSGRAVSTDAISSLNKEGAAKATALWQGESSCSIRQLTEFPFRPFKMLPWAVFYHNHRRFVWPRRRPSPLTGRVLADTEGCLTLAERRGRGGVGGASLSMDSWDFWRLSFTCPRLSYR